MNEPRFEVFPEKYAAEGRWPPKPTGEFVWHFKDANGRITFTGGESFTRREDAHRSIRGSVLDSLRLSGLYGPAVNFNEEYIAKALPIVDLDEDGEVT